MSFLAPFFDFTYLYVQIRYEFNFLLHVYLNPKLNRLGFSVPLLNSISICLEHRKFTYVVSAHLISSVARRSTSEAENPKSTPSQPQANPSLKSEIYKRNDRR
jgi:hypothetical protein